jgi:hypothetical protein
MFPYPHTSSSLKDLMACNTKLKNSREGPNLQQNRISLKRQNDLLKTNSEAIYVPMKITNNNCLTRP